MKRQPRRGRLLTQAQLRKLFDLICLLLAVLLAALLAALGIKAAI